MINNKLLRNLDCTLIGVTVLLNIISIIMIGSATHVNSIAEDRYWYMQRQGIFFLVNVLIVFFPFLTRTANHKIANTAIT